MIIPIIAATVIFYSCAAYMYFRENEPAKTALVFSIIPALLGSAFFGSIGWTVAYTIAEDEVPLSWSIVEGPNGRYIEDGTVGESNTPVNFYFYRSNEGGIKRSYKAVGESSIVYTESNPHIEANCKAASTVPDWLLPFWMDGTETDCSYSDFTIYVPRGN